MTRVETGYPQEHGEAAGSSDAGNIYRYGRWDEPLCRGRIQAVYVRLGSSSKWTRVGSLCVRCAVYWPNVAVLESIDPVSDRYGNIDPAAAEIRRRGAVDRRPVTVRDLEPPLEAALPDVDDVLAGEAVDGGQELEATVDGDGDRADRLQLAAGDEPSTASDGHVEPSTATGGRLPRGTCPECGNDVAIRRNGVTREHHLYRAQADQDPLEHLGRMTVCPGSGRLPAAAATVDAPTTSPDRRRPELVDAAVPPPEIQHVRPGPDRPGGGLTL